MRFWRFRFFLTHKAGELRNSATPAKANYHIEQNKIPESYAQAKHHPGAVATRAARLLCAVPIAGAGAQVRGTTEALQGDARLPGHDGGTDTARHKGESQQARQPSPTAPTVRQQVADVDDSATPTTGVKHRNLQRVPSTIRGHSTTTNQIPLLA